MSDSAQDRNLPASERKIKKAREDGQVARSRDFGHFAAITACVALVAALAPEVTDLLKHTVSDGLRFDANFVAHPAQMGERLWQMTLKLLTVLLPLFGTMLAVGVAASLLVGGWNFTTKAFMPDFSKINPISGLARLFSGQQLTDTLKTCLLALLLGTVGGTYLWQHWTEHAQMLSMPLPAALANGAGLLKSGLFLLCGLLALFALVDVPLQREMLMRRLRMSKEEVKKEYKETEGNAEIKGKMKQLMRQAATRRMMAAVPTADLVVMNPSHFAVALKYDEKAMGAPRVVAKGADLIALRIRDLARESKVPVLQAPPLARALFAHTEVDQEIPARLFSAVAQVLAWVYQLRDAMAAGRSATQDAPTPEVPADMDPMNNASPLYGTPLYRSDASSDASSEDALNNPRENVRKPVPGRAANERTANQRTANERTTNDRTANTRKEPEL
jgi:flagellar biosynthesis protein FlhB